MRRDQPAPNRSGASAGHSGAPIPYIFLLGQAHSGSTLLAFLANAHPEVLSAGETNRIDQLLPERWRGERRDGCSCGVPYAKCGFWTRSLAGLAADGYGLGMPDSFSYRRGQRRLAHSKFAALIRSMLEVAGKSVYFDASKHFFCLPPLVKNRSLRLSVVDLYRDGRAIVQSWRENNPQASDESLVREFRRRERKRRQVLADVPPERVFRLQYETLCRETRSVLRDLFTFAGVEPTVDVTVGYKTVAEHHIIGNQMRLNREETIAPDEKWRSSMTHEMRRTFDQIAGQTNADNGYRA